MKQYVVREFTESVSEKLFGEDKSAEEWLNDEIADHQKNGYSLETVSQSMSNINDIIYRSVILIMSK